MTLYTAHFKLTIKFSRRSGQERSERRHSNLTIHSSDEAKKAVGQLGGHRRIGGLCGDCDRLAVRNRRDPYAACVQNVRYGVRRVREAFADEAQNGLSVVGAVYDIRTGGIDWTED